VRHKKINQQTIERYLDFFKDSFLLREARRYDLKGRKEIGALRSKNKEGKSIRKTNEVDFYATKGLRAYYIQVTADISNEITREREIRPYYLLNDQVQKILVVNKPFGETRDNSGFTIIGITDFLLRFIK